MTMTVSPVRFGYGYFVAGDASDRQQARQDAVPYAAQQGVDLEILPDAGTGKDAYFTQGDATTYRNNRSEIQRFFAIRKRVLDAASAALQASLGGFGHISAGDEDNYNTYMTALANEKGNSPMTALSDLFGIETDPFAALAPTPSAQDISDGATNGWLDVATGN